MWWDRVPLDIECKSHLQKWIKNYATKKKLFLKFVVSDEYIYIKKDDISAKIPHEWSLAIPKSRGQIFGYFDISPFVDTITQ